MTTTLSLTVVTDPTTVPPTVDTSRLSWATSLFYFGMAAGAYPLSYAIQLLPVRRVLCGVVCLWAAICMSTAGVTSWQGLYVQRFFLGLVESVVPTAFTLLVSGFYTQAEQALRQSVWLAATGMWIIIGGALNYGFAQIKGGGLQGWQWIYLLAGVLTLAYGIGAFWLPSSPVEARFLSREEKVVAVERLRLGQTGVRCEKLKWAQVREALLDIKVWLCFVMMAST